MNSKLYYILFFIYVVLDVFTTVYLLVNGSLTECNPHINFLIENTNTGIFYLIFLLLKVISFEIINYIIDFSNNSLFKYCNIIFGYCFLTKYINYSGYIIYIVIFIMSSYVGINNILLM